MTRPNLKVVDPETGELHGEDCPSCLTLRDQVAGAERDIRAWRQRCANLERDRITAAREHPLWDEARELFAYWAVKCRHPKSKWTADRFWQVEPLLSEYGLAMCKRTIDGAAYDPYTTNRRNGTVKRHDDFELLFRNAGKLEEFANRAPRRDT